MSTPVRVQLKRIKGWKMPANTVSVARLGPFGNPFVVGEPSGHSFNDGGSRTPLIAELTLEQCVEFYERLIHGILSPEMHPRGHLWLDKFRRRFGGEHPAEYVRSHLQGKNLACFCALDQPCHADVLLKFACGEVAG